MSRSPAALLEEETSSSCTVAASAVEEWMHDAVVRGWEEVGANADVVARRAMLSRARGKIMVKVFFEKVVSKDFLCNFFAESETWRQICEHQR